MYTVNDVVFFVIRHLGGVQGLKKLVKLVFLADYERMGDVVIKYLYGGEPLSRARFYIWTFGPMSNEVYRVVDGDLIEAQQDELGRVVLYTRAEPHLPTEVQTRLREVLAKYGELRGGQLERLALKLLKLRPEDKADYMGMWIDDYLREVGLKLKLVDLAAAQAP